MLTFLSVANSLQVFKIAKQKGSLTVSEPTIDFPKVSSHHFTTCVCDSPFPSLFLTITLRLTQLL